MRLQSIKKVGVDVHAFVSPCKVLKRCPRCKLTVSCQCLKPSPLLSKKEQKSIVYSKSWLIGWCEGEEDSSEDEHSTSHEETEVEESGADESFVFSEPGKSLPVEESGDQSDEEEQEESEEEEFDPNKAFVEYELDESAEELPSFGFLVENLLNQSNQ